LNYKQIVGKANFDLKCDFTNLKTSNLGPFLADATKYYLQSTGNPADFSLVASGTIREDLVKGQNGIITVPDVFRVMSLGKGYDNVPGYPLAKIYITANEVKKLMEVLVMSRAKGGDGFIYFSGIKTSIDSKKGFLKKVQKIEINGKEIDYSKENPQLFCITANTYLLSFIGRIKKMSHGLVKIIPKDKDGKPITDMKNQLIDIDSNKEGVQEAKEWIAVIEYMKSFNKNSDGLPVIPDKYKMGDGAILDLVK
jgi:5'-nucleotidase / UDP-sugar diphosphatase